jgi:hypothetical protein
MLREVRSPSPRTRRVPCYRTHVLVLWCPVGRAKARPLESSDDRRIDRRVRHQRGEACKAHPQGSPVPRHLICRGSVSRQRDPVAWRRKYETASPVCRQNRTPPTEHRPALRALLARAGTTRQLIASVCRANRPPCCGGQNTPSFGPIWHGASAAWVTLSIMRHSMGSRRASRWNGCATYSSARKSCPTGTAPCTEPRSS